MQKHDQDYIKRKNKATVFQLIKNHSPISRAAIAKMTGLSPTTVGRIADELSERGFLRESKDPNSSGLGRKAAMLELDRTSVLTIGIEIDKAKIKIGIVDFDGRIIARREFKREAEETEDQTIERIGHSSAGMISDERIDPAKIIGIGVGLPGIVDAHNGEVILSAQLRWKRTHLAEKLRKVTGYDVVVDNELKTKALAEHCYGSAKGSKRAALVGFGSGVGSALIINGEIYRGETNSAGEIGHTIVDPSGVMCECGKIGCLQTYIAESSLLNESNKVKPISTLDELFGAKRSGEFWAAGIVDRAIAFMGITVSNIVCLYNPDTVILSGDLVENYQEVRDFFEGNSLQPFVWEPLRDTFRIVYSEMGHEGVMVGSAVLAQDKFLNFES